MMTRPWTEDSRYMLLMLAADDADVAIGALIARWRRSTKRGRLSQNLRNLETAGLIVRTDSGAGAVEARLFRITAPGRQIVFGAVDPESLWARPWDGKWRMAMFDIPQARAALRTRLRRKLRELRFGAVQNSVWLSPDPVNQLVAHFAHVEMSVESLLFLEGRPVGGASDADLVAAAWDFATLARHHAAYLKILRARPASGRTAKTADWSAWCTAELRAWREILLHDPFLPEALLPRDYLGQVVWQARCEGLRSTGRALAEAEVVK